MTMTRYGALSKVYMMMMYKIRYLSGALENLIEIRKYLKEFSTETANKTLKEIKSRIANLKETPFMCEKYHDNPSYRRMVISNYLVFYVVNEETHIIEIHRVLHYSQNVRKYF